MTGAVERDPRFPAAFRDGVARMHEALFDRGADEVALAVPGIAKMIAAQAARTVEARVAALMFIARGVARSPRRGLRDAGLAVAAAELVLLQTFTSAHGDAVVDAIWDSCLADLRTGGDAQAVAAGCSAGAGSSPS